MQYVGFDGENENIIFAAVAFSHGAQVSQIAQAWQIRQVKIAKVEAAISEQRRLELRIQTPLWRK